MDKLSNILDRLPELPLELFELAGKLALAEVTPVITNRPDPVTTQPPAVTPRTNRASHDIRVRYGWVIYPKVICYPFPDPEVFEAFSLREFEERSCADQTDLAGVAAARRYYKLTGFRGFDPAFCEVRYGPWFAQVTERESCDDQIPTMWELDAPDPGIVLSWLGTWADMPSLPNLTVIVDVNSIAKSWSECCPGFYFCPTSGGCIPTSVSCPGAQPA